MLDKILDVIGKFSYRRRYLVAVLALVLFIGVSILQSFTVIAFSYSDYNKVNDIFPEDDTLVIVYENSDEGNIPSIAAFLSENEYVESVQSYATTLGMQMSPAALSAVAGIDESFIKTLLYMKENGIRSDGMTFVEFINFLASDEFMSNELFADRFDAEMKAKLTQMKTLVNAIATDAQLDSASLAAMFGIDAQMVDGIFQMTGSQTMSIEMFANYMSGMVQQNPNMISPEQAASFTQMTKIINLSKSTNILTPAQLAGMFADMTQSTAINESTVTLLCVMYDAMRADMSSKTIALYDFFIFITESILPSPTFSSFFNDSTKAMMLSAKDTMESGKAQLIGPNHSRMIVTLNYEIESESMYDFYKMLEKELDARFDGEYYLVGTTAMSNELSKTFRTEYLMISIITALAIFTVVCFTFKKVTISAILVCIIECAVFITMSVMGIVGSQFYFLALIVVQCVLMGAMVDYGIIFSNYYIEVRREFSREEALPEVLKRSIRAIATSAIILVAITFVCGWFMVGAVASILAALCLGAFSALILVLFALPSLLAILDKVIIKDKSIKSTETDENIA